MSDTNNRIDVYEDAVGNDKITFSGGAGEVQVLRTAPQNLTPEQVEQVKKNLNISDLKSVYITASGHLMVVDSNGNTLDAGDARGLPGQAPYVGRNGNWWVSDQDTGVKAEGVTPHIGENGNWCVGDTDTGLKAQGDTPYINADGYWCIGDKNTRVQAQMHLTGDIKETMRTDLGEEWLLCNGAVLPREAYPALRGWLENDLTYRTVQGLPKTGSEYGIRIPLMNGEWVFAQASITNDYYLTCYIYDPNTETLKTVDAPTNTELGTYYVPSMLGITFDGEKYVRILGYSSVTSTASYQTIYVQTSVDADVWETVMEYTRETDYYYRELYFDGARILMGGYRTVSETVNSSTTTYYYKKVWVIDLAEKTVTALTDGEEKSKTRTRFNTVPTGYWAYSKLCRVGETEPCFPLSANTGTGNFFNERFIMTAGSAKADFFDLQTGDNFSFHWSMILGGNVTYDCYGSFYDEATNTWRFAVYYDTDTDKYYNVYISADADPREPSAWRVELTALTSKETSGGAIGRNRSRALNTGSSSNYGVSLYDSTQRFLPMNDGETYKYIYGYGEVEEAVPETPDYVVNDAYAPDGYERLYALESTGTQYIDMGFAPRDNMRSTVYGTLPPVDGESNAMYGANDGTTGSKNAYDLFVSSSYPDRYYFNYGNKQSYSTDGSVTYGMILVHRKGYIGYVNGYVAGSNGSFEEPTNSLYLFGRNSAGTLKPGYCKICFAKFYEADDTLIRDFIPVRRISDGALGMWDKVTEEFYGNNGTGEFVAHEYGEEKQSVLLDYIATTGGQYIDTGVKPTQNTRIEAEISGWDSSETGTYLYNAGTSLSLQITSDKLYRAYYGAAYKDFASTVNAADRVTTTRGGMTAWIGDASVTNAEKTFTSTYNLFLFAQNTSTSGSAANYAKLRLHYFKIYEGNELIRDYVPCRNKYGAICLYDRVSKKCIYNAGAYEFTAGPEIGIIEEENE